MSPYLLLMIVLSANGSHVVTPIGGRYADKEICHAASLDAWIMQREGPRPSVSFACVQAGMPADKSAP